MPWIIRHDILVRCKRNIENTPATNTTIVLGASKQFLAEYLLKSSTIDEGHHLVGSSLEVVMDKFSTFASPNYHNFVSGSKRFVYSGMRTMHSIMALNSDAYPTFRFGKTVRRNPTTLTANYKNKWENVGFMNGYYVVGITTIPYPSYRVIINIISKDDITYRITIGDIPHCTGPNFTKMSSQALGKKGRWVYCKHLYYVFRFLCKVNYESDKFIHASTYTYNEVMHLLELAGVVECE